MLVLIFSLAVMIRLSGLGLAILGFLIALVTADPECSPIFGSPDYSFCKELVNELFNNWPGEPGTDAYLHYFALPGVEFPSWVGRPSRRAKVTELPKFAGSGKSNAAERLRREILSVISAGQTPGCLMSLMPIRGLDGGISVDLGYYHSMSISARQLNRLCVNRGMGLKSGGFTHVGTLQS